MGCTVVGNLATNGGGVIQGLVQNSTISGNTVTGARALGGGTYNARVVNSLIFGNTSAYQGGGSYGGSLVNCTIIQNVVLGIPFAGGGAGVASGSLTNCIVYFNTGPATGQNFTNCLGDTLDHCCTTPLFTGTGNFTNAPLLATISHLSTNSPCITAGNFTAFSGTDIDGEPWANPPSVGCDQLYPNNAVGSLTVSILAAFTNLAPGYSETFFANNTGPILASIWDFGDGTVLTNQSTVVHGWSATGDYPVVLTVYNSTYPAGQSTTLLMHIVVPPVNYVDLNSLNPIAPYSTWATAATNIQDAVDVAAPGAVVMVTNGVSPIQTNGIAVYQFGGHVVHAPSLNRVAINSPITVQSVNGPAVTIIKGLTTPTTPTRCVYLTNGAVLSGFTLTNGNVNDGSGGAGTWAESTNAVITNCIIVGCRSTSVGAGGGGSYSGTLWNCILRTNSANTGGGANLSALNNCTLIQNVGSMGGGAANSLLNNCVFNSNSAPSGFGGGTYACSATNCTYAGNSSGSSGASGNGGGAFGGVLSGCVLNGNIAFSGGAVCGSAAGGAAIVVNNCIISNNVAQNGAGAYCNPGNYCILNNCLLSSNTATFLGGGADNATLNNCIVSNNSSLFIGGGCAGGALSNCTVIANHAKTTGGGADSAFLNKCILISNTATNSSGGGANQSSLFGCFILSNSTSSTAINTGGGGTSASTVSNCVLAFNSAATYGGGDYKSTLVNCTIVSNSAPTGGGVANSTADNCIIYYNAGGNYSQNQFSPALAVRYCCTTPATNGSGNITNEPALVNFAAGDFHLQSSSPCINSGANLFIHATNDLDGNPRIVAGTVDVGAYEYQSPTSVLSYAWAQLYGFPTDGSADYLDLDGTGMNNWQKSIAGLNPTNSASVFAMMPPVFDTNSSGLVVNWLSVSDRTYYLQRATNIAAQPAFSTIQSNLPGSLTETNSFIDTNATGSGPYFYRVGVQQ